MFRKGGMSESMQGSVEIKGHEKETFSRMLEYVYTNKVSSLDTCHANEIISLLIMSNEYCLEDLQHLCESAASQILNLDNIGTFMKLAHANNCASLKSSCVRFACVNKSDLCQDEKFRQEVEESPILGLLLFDAMDMDLVGSSSSSAMSYGVSSSLSSNKRRRVTEPADIHASSQVAVASSVAGGGASAGGANTIAQPGNLI
jgi:BTB/POZ domain